MKYDAIVLGGGVAGCCCAAVLSDIGKKVLIIEKTCNLGGQAYDEIASNGVLVQMYGPHIIYGDDLEVPSFLSKYSNFNEIQMTVVAEHNGKYIPLPMNFHTFDAMLGATTGAHIQKFLLQHWNYGSKVKFSEVLATAKKYDTLEVQHLQYVLEELYGKYSKKMWGEKFKNNTGIDRVPVVIGYTQAYFPATYYYVPSNSYTAMFKNMVRNKNISILLNTTAKDVISIKDNTIVVANNFLAQDGIIINTTRIDELFAFKFGALEFRSLEFDYTQTTKRLPANTVHYPVQYTYTRITDMMNILGKTEGSQNVHVKETPVEFDPSKHMPLYVIQNDSNINRAQQYLDYSKQHFPQIVHIGRASEYKYYAMVDLISKCISKSWLK